MIAAARWLSAMKLRSNFSYRTVLVTHTQHLRLTLAQLYRDRADAENNFAELKNQWGWCGFTTQNIARYRLMARMVALVYNGWSLFVRLAQPHTAFLG